MGPGGAPRAGFGVPAGPSPRVLNGRAGFGAGGRGGPAVAGSGRAASLRSGRSGGYAYGRDGSRYGDRAAYAAGAYAAGSYAEGAYSGDRYGRENSSGSECYYVYGRSGRVAVCE
jgi:hypothetical protein